MDFARFHFRSASHLSLASYMAHAARTPEPKEHAVTHTMVWMYMHRVQSLAIMVVRLLPRVTLCVLRSRGRALPTHIIFAHVVLYAPSACLPARLAQTPRSSLSPFELASDLASRFAAITARALCRSLWLVSF